MAKKPETNKLKKLSVKKETIADLEIQNPDQVKGGTGTYGCPQDKTKNLAPSPAGRPYSAGCPTVV